MNALLRWLIYGSAGLAAAIFAYTAVKTFFLTKYADYQERMLGELQERSGGLALVIDLQKLQHLTLLLCSGLFLLGALLGGRNLFTGLFLGGVLVIPGLLAPRAICAMLLARRLEKISEQLPVGLELLINSMRAGLTLPVALERCLDRMPQELQEELNVVLHEFHLGASLSDAMVRWSDRLGLADVKMMAASSVLALQRGGSLVEAYQSLDDIIHQRADFNRELKALTAEGRFQALLMTALPFVLLIIMTALNHDTMIAFFIHPVGKLLLLLMVAMQVGAFFWIRSVMKVDK